MLPPALCWFLGPHDGTVGAGQRTRQLVDALIAAGLSVQFIREPPPTQNVPLREAVAAIRTQWQKERPLCVHIEVPATTGEAWRIAAMELGIPLTCTWHPIAWMAPDAEKDDISRWLRFFVGNCQQVLTETREVRLALAADAVLDTTMSVTGVSSVRFSPSKRSAKRRQQWGAEKTDPVILHVGRLQPEKNLGLLAAAFNAIVATNPRARCIVAGSGTVAEELVRDCPHIRLLGYISGDELAEVYASADLFLFPSNEDMYGNVTLEAAASGLPVVAFDRAAAGAHLQHAAALVPLNDNQAFIESALALTNTPAERHRLGTAARAVMARVTWADTAQQFITAIKRAHRGFSKWPTVGIKPVTARIRAVLPDDPESEPLATIRFLNARGHHIAWDHDPAIELGEATIHIANQTSRLSELIADPSVKDAPPWTRLRSEGRLCAWAHQRTPLTEVLQIAACHALPFATSGAANRFAQIVAEMRNLGHAIKTHADPMTLNPVGKTASQTVQEHMKKLFAYLHHAWTHDRPQIVYIEVLDIFGVSAARAAQHLGIPWVATWHPLGDWVKADHRETFEAGLHALAATATALVAESQTQYELALAAKLPCTRIVGNGVDHERFSPRHRSEDLRASWNCATAVLAVGRLRAAKNVTQLIQVYHSLSVIPGARLIIAGDGEERPALEKAMPGALFLGLVADKELPAIYASADLFVFPSRVESYGMVVAEALASGLPVIGYDRAAITDLITDGVNGRRVPLSTDPESNDLAQAVVAFCSRLPDPAVTTAARATAEKCSWQRSAELLAAELTRVAQTLPPRVDTKGPAITVDVNTVVSGDPHYPGPVLKPGDTAVGPQSRF